MTRAGGGARFDEIKRAFEAAGVSLAASRA
jgi:hypothetical protein